MVIVQMISGLSAALLWLKCWSLGHYVTDHNVKIGDF